MYKYINTSYSIHSVLLVHVYDSRANYLALEGKLGISLLGEEYFSHKHFLLPTASLFKGGPGEITASVLAFLLVVSFLRTCLHSPSVDLS